MGAIIGISGYSGSGKDYVANGIIRDFPEYKFKKMYFAAHLKKCAAIMLGLPEEMMYTQEGKQYKIPWLDNMTVRTFLQKFGSDAIRNNIHTDFWVKQLMSQIGDHDNVVIPDMRFPNEFDAISKRGITARISRITTVEKWNEVSGLMTINPVGGIISKQKYIRLTSDMYGNESDEVKSLTHISETALDNNQFDTGDMLRDGEQSDYSEAIAEYIFNNGHILYGKR